MRGARCLVTPSSISLISFDVDGTLEYGDPAGPVTRAMVCGARQRGHLIGTASDRTLLEQGLIWEQLGLEPDFVGHKHHLDRIRDRFSPIRLMHIGDTPLDRHFANLAGFEFWDVTLLPDPGTPGWVY